MKTCLQEKVLLVKPDQFQHVLQGEQAFTFLKEVWNKGCLQWF